MNEKELARERLYGLLGDLPERQREIAVHCIKVEERGQYILEKLLLDLNGIEPAPAYYTRPKNATGRIPVVLYNHAHGGDYVLGKDELIKGRSLLQEPPYAQALAENGYAALCFDTWAFGERRGRTESQIFKHMLLHGQVMWGMMVYDSLRAVDYLLSRDDVDPGRIATIGLSMGSTMAWWVSALQTRVKVCIDLCCLTDLESLIEANGLDRHGIYYYVPNLLKFFTTAQINALITPRPHLGIVGIYDSLTPPAGIDRIDREVEAAYREENAAGAWKLLRYHTGHFETASMRQEVITFLKEWL